MIIKINTTTLSIMLKTISNAVQKNRKDIILSNILIKIIKNNIFCIAINEEIEIITYEKLDTTELDGEVIITYELINNICKNNKKNSIITIKKTNNTIEIYAENSIFNLPYINNQTYPSFKKDIETLTKLKLKTENIKNLFSKSHLAISENNPQTFLSGIFLDINKYSLTTLSSDGSKLFFNQILNNQENKNLKLIIPKTTILTLLTILEDNTYTYITISNTFIKFTTKNIIITSKLINSTYNNPNIKISSNSNKSIIIEKNDLKDALEKIGILCANNSKIILEIKKNLLTIKAKNKNEHVSTTISINNNEFNAIIGLNYRHLVDIIKNIKTNNFELIITQSEESLIIKEINSTYLYILIPFKL